MLLLLVQGLFSAVAGGPSLPAHTVCGSEACYTAHLDKKPFHQALERCKTNGGNLATAKNAGEALLVHGLLSGFLGGLRPNTKRKFWLGLQLPPRYCYQRHKPLRGFGWTSGGEETTYSNWAREPQGTCTAHRCVHIISTSSPGGDNYKWLDGVCGRGVDGYICKFNFKGMCPNIDLSGPGSITYTTPFNTVSSSLALVPFGSLAVVSCGSRDSPESSYLLCVEQVPGRYGWSSDGPFCTPPSGCDLENGGCAQICVRARGGGYKCQCGPGYELGKDQHSCESLDHCRGHPCQYKCVSRSQGFECLCPVGYQLAQNGSSCVDTDECAHRPCQGCINTLGSFRCDCPEGYGLIRDQCRDLDTCSGHPCDHICQNTDGSYRCHCRAGYRLRDADQSCVDLNECSSQPCEGSCINTEGSFECSCSEGYALGEDQVSCVPTGLTTTAEPSAAPAATWGPTTSRALVVHAADSTTSIASSGILAQPDPATEASAAVENGAATWTSVPSPTAAQNPGTSWLLVCALGSVAVLLLVLCVVGLILYFRYRSTREKSGHVGDYYNWVQAARQSPFRASHIKCNRSSDNYIEIEASQTEV
ncbi:complement component C1q receptor-like [Narcine bancroftii]|uniref:complement component C1q receptor-like n=1 Tax=Narcine bancroftii TaxID=1343680 RepID=UPI0038311D2A